MAGGGAAGGSFSGGGGANLSYSLTLNASPFRKGLSIAKRSVVGFTGFLTKAFYRAGQVVTRIVKGMLNPLTVLAGGFSLGSVIWQVESLNAAMAQSTSIMGDLTQTMRSDMRQAAIETSKRTVFSATQAAQAYYFLASAGLDAATSLKSLPEVAQFAQAGAMDLAQAVDLVGGAQGALGLASKDATTHVRNMRRVMDVLAKSSIVAQGNINQFSTALSAGAGGAARQLGKDVEEVTALLAVFASQNIRGAEAGTAASIVYRELGRLANENAAEFERFGVEVYDKATGRFRNTADIIEQLTRSMEGLTDQQKQARFAQMGFTAESMKFFNMVIGRSDDLRTFEAALRDAGGTSAEVAAKMVTPWRKALNELKGAFSQWAESFTPVVETLTALTTGAASILSSGMAMKAGSFIADIVVDTMKMIANGFQLAIQLFLKVVKDIQGLFGRFRNSGIAKKMGIGFESDEEEMEALTSWGNTIKAYRNFKAMPWAGDIIQSTVDRGRAIGKLQDYKAQGMEIGKQAGETLRDVINKGSLLASGDWRNVFGMGGTGRPVDLSSLASNDMAERMERWWGTMLQGASRVGQRNMANSPSAQMAGPVRLAGADTREGYAQRVRALGVSEDTKIAKQQLNVANKSNKYLEQIAKAANGGFGLVTVDLTQ